MSCQSCNQGILGFLHLRFGRCVRCMKLSLYSAVFLWVIAGILSFIPEVGTSPVIALMLLAGLSSAFWIAHVSAFAHRKAQITRNYLEVSGADRSRRTFIQSGAKAVLAATTVSLPIACTKNSTTLTAAVADIVWCDCYFDKDCGFLFYCRYDVECTWVPKGIEEGDEHGRECPGSSVGSCDGLCKFLKLPYGTVSREIFANAADLIFKSYIKAAEGATPHGQADASYLAQAQSIKLPGDSRNDLNGAIFSAIELVAGWDFGMAHRDMSLPDRPGTEGFFRGFPKEGGLPDIIDAVRQGFVEVIRSGDEKAIVPPILKFWEVHPNFRPNHGGRCYPHGHGIYNVAVECQVENLQKIAVALAADDA